MSTAAVAHSEYLGEILVRRGVVAAERVAPLFEAVRERGQTLTDLLVQQNITDEKQIAKALADECGLDFYPKIDLDAIPDEVAGRLPITYAKQHEVLPLAIYTDHVYVVTADPLDTTALDDIRTLFGLPPVV